MAARNLTPKLSRREVLGLGAIGAAGVAVALTGCSAQTGASGGAGNVLKSGLEIGPVADVPVGGGRNFEVEGTKLVVTQPTEGELLAFSAICTHEGCVVGCRDKEIRCDCHSAIFSMTDGEPISGPADGALQNYPVVVTDGVIYTA
ncbi:nitrite reductase/ring-hydroxylating ferredoxin subunit [Aurantimicrobium minutum]|uniref:Rieske (2Fe-2S) protein n=1 Tax=Aurantimicrobium minutum TaxID=708131 RepID=UPI00247578A7|nr:Rieske (2Fe-2S) protein [Aurantimicrobium minutum]MDH6424502.1 nitrite reductase/ring-hydroxylating ferredoxin subunit [Aurantimicrobium minutum]